MEVRKVAIDFSDAAVHWNPDRPEWCHIWNAMSTGVPALEQFLIKVVRQAKDELAETAPAALRDDIAVFVAQEGRHFRLHMGFNKLLEAKGYDFAAAELKLRADYDRYLEDKGLKFCLAYCEGFETFGPIIATLFFEHSADMMKDWHEPSCHLWRWHIAEEFEHRTVVNYTYKHLFDDYWTRVYGLWFAAAHLFGYALRVGWHMTQSDLRTGALRGRLRRAGRFAHATWRIASGVVPPMVTRAMRPSYDPGTLRPPRNVMELLAETSRKYGVVVAA